MKSGWDFIPTTRLHNALGDFGGKMMLNPVHAKKSLFWHKKKRAAHWSAQLVCTFF
jgi:hypothetical protein